MEYFVILPPLRQGVGNIHQSLYYFGTAPDTYPCLELYLTAVAHVEKEETGQGNVSQKMMSLSRKVQAGNDVAKGEQKKDGHFSTWLKSDCCWQRLNLNLTGLI